MKKLFFYAGILLCFSNCGCHKHSDENVAPVLTIITPSANQVYKSGDNVVISGSVTDNSLHELRIDITVTATGASLYNNVISVHDLTSYTINNSWKSSVTTSTAATVKVEVEDHSGNVAEKKVSIVINP
jgi:hypothetical protein